jgi:uncharacterized C2H2 Zn-finger protein
MEKPRLIEVKKVKIAKSSKPITKCKSQVIDTTKQFKCPQCSKTFDKHQSLGGHQSKAHPGTSKSYSYKIERREAGTFNRDVIKVVKQCLGPEFPR